MYRMPGGTQPAVRGRVRLEANSSPGKGASLEGGERPPGQIPSGTTLGGHGPGTFELPWESTT